MSRLLLALSAASFAERQRAQALLAEQGIDAEIVDEAELKKRIEQVAPTTPLPEELLKVRPPSLPEALQDFDPTERTDRAWRRRKPR
jgi:hypothetical protein